MLQQITNTINDLDLDSDNDEQSGRLQKASANGANPDVVVTQKLNAMTLFAYNADDHDDNLASAFSQSRLF